jgi:DegV family protein with EDD domain
MTNNVKFIVDSTTDLSLEYLAEKDIPLVPAFVNFGGESYPDDGIALTKQEFYERLENDKILPTTSSVSVGTARDAIEKQLTKAEHVVVFTVAKQLSGIYNTMRLAAQEFDQSRVTLYDTGSLSMGGGFQVQAAVEAQERGEPLEAIIAAVRSTGERIRLLCAIDNLEHLRRGGRVSSLMAGIGTLLQIKPIVDVVEGQVLSGHRVRTMSRAIQWMVDEAVRQSPLERLVVLHAANMEGAQDMLKRLESVAPPGTYITEAATAIGTHVGPHALALSYVRKNK